MKKFITLLLNLALIYSCSTSNDGNGNSTTTVVPIAPSNLTGTVASTTQINLSWTDNSTNETGFKIERKTGTGTYAVVVTTAADVNTFVNTGLTPGTTYTYRVYSNNAVGNSLTYSNEISLTTTSYTVTDLDGNSYQSATNCGLTYTKTNLNVSKYSDGTTIPQVTDHTQWNNLTTGAWCYYNNDSTNGITLGKLYNWYAVAGIYDDASAANPALRKKLAPTGWHIPTNAEWTQLGDCLGGFDVAGGKMKSTGTIEAGTGFWLTPNTGATNESGFTGLPGSCRVTGFSIIGDGGYWWSSTEYTSTYVHNRCLIYDSDKLWSTDGNPNNGFSVRCFKN